MLIPPVEWKSTTCHIILGVSMCNFPRITSCLMNINKDHQERFNMLENFSSHDKIKVSKTVNVSASV